MDWLEDLRSLVGSVSTEILDSINEASKLSNDIMQRAIDALFKLDPKLAEKAIETKSSQIPVLKRVEGLALELDAHAALPLHCIATSIDRIASTAFRDRLFLEINCIHNLIGLYRRCPKKAQKINL